MGSRSSSTSPQANGCGTCAFSSRSRDRLKGTLTTPTWKNSRILGPYHPDTIRRLKNDIDRDLYVSGSGATVRAMLADGLVDELHLFVYPLTRGTGPRLFPEDAPPLKWSLTTSASFNNGVVYLTYRLLQ